MAACASSPGAEGSSIASAAAEVDGDSNRPRAASTTGPRRRGRGGAGRMFVAATEQLDSGTPVVRVMGEVDLATVKELEQALLDAAESRTGAMIVDLTGCTFLDSSGLRALVETRQRLEHASGRLALVLSTPGVLRIFQITALDHVFEIYPSLAAAVDGDGVGKGSSIDPARPTTLQDQVG